MELDLECVASFAVLCEEGHFGHAAARLHLTSPALTKRIQRLENQVGVALLERDASGATSLTAAGWSFARLATTLLQQARAAQDAARSAAHPTTQHPIRLGVPGAYDVAPYRLVRERLGRATVDQAQDITVHFVSVPYTQPLDFLSRGLIDVLWSPSSVADSRFSSYRLGATQRVGIVATAHPLAGQDGVAAAEFARCAILYNPAVPSALMCAGYLVDVRPLAAACLVPTKAQTLAALQADVAGSKGVAVLPLLLAQAVGPGVETVTLQGLRPTTVWALHRREDRRPEVLALLRLLRSVVTDSSDDTGEPPQVSRSLPTALSDSSLQSGGSISEIADCMRLRPPSRKQPRSTETPRSAAPRP